MTWDGMEARSKTDDPERWRGFNGVINATPPEGHYLGFVLTWQGWWIFHLDQQLGFVDLLAETSPGELSASGETIWCAAVPKRANAEIRISARRVDGEVRLTWAEFNAYQSHAKNRRSQACQPLPHRVRATVCTTGESLVRKCSDSPQALLGGMGIVEHDLY